MALKVKGYYYGTGRRKSGVARVFIKPGKGTFSINGRSIEDYFGGRKSAHIVVQQPIELVDMQGRFDVMVTVAGSGPMAQAAAIRHGLTHALIQYDEETNEGVKVNQNQEDDSEEGGSGESSVTSFRRVLRSAGLVTRDSREVERKKVGLRGARKAVQYSKR